MSEQSQIMETIDIANGALSVSRIGLGTWAIGGWMWGGTDERQSIETIHAAVDRGVTLFDTAPVYGFGRAEEILGKALAQDNRRARVAIATKVGLDWRDSTPFRDASKTRIVKEGLRPSTNTGRRRRSTRRLATMPSTPRCQSSP